MTKCHDLSVPILNNSSINEGTRHAMSVIYSALKMFESKIGVFWLSLFFLCSLHRLGSGKEALENFDERSEETGKCETINVNLCASLPYNGTRLPNSFGHSTQEAVNNSLYARAQEFNVICSDLLLFFVCAIHLPICIGKPTFSGKIIGPCRSVCERVKADCNATLQTKSMKWPDDRQYMCERLPLYNESMCVTPEAFVHSGRFRSI